MIRGFKYEWIREITVGQTTDAECYFLTTELSSKTQFEQLHIEHGMDFHIQKHCV